MVSDEKLYFLLRYQKIAESPPEPVKCINMSTCISPHNDTFEKNLNLNLIRKVYKLVLAF